jgi:DNA-binding TFAR19-related protein (PDSD5 family)
MESYDLSHSQRLELERGAFNSQQELMLQETPEHIARRRLNRVSLPRKVREGKGVCSNEQYWH